MGTKQFFDAVGLGTPFILALGIYGFFHWLDRNSSVQAKSTIAKWLKGQDYKGLDLKAALISTFDRLYGAPLLRIRAFVRSAVISLVGITILSWINSLRLVWSDYNISVYEAFVPNVFDIEFSSIIVIADYISLFFVRKLLSVSGTRPLLAFSLAIVISGFVVITVIIAILALRALYEFGYGQDIFEGIRRIIQINSYEWIILILSPAFFVHLWLPLFGLGALAVRGFYLFFDLARLAQWFLKGGSRHPVRAVGAAAAILVFTGTGIATAIGRLHPPPG
jgi:hypothetical protein